MKLLLDTDIGSDIDDAVCLAYLLAQPACELLGITTVTGEPRRRAKLASALCKVAGQDIPIYPGAPRPLIVDPRQTAAPQAAALSAWAHKTDFPAPGEAVEFLRHTIRANPGEVTLLTIGPLTNIALLFATDPEIPSLLKALVIMGGFFHEPDKHHEWNIMLDPHASAIVYRARPAVHRSIGLDVTLQVRMEANVVRQKFSPALLRPVLDFAEVWFEDQPVITFHDPLAAATLFDEQICEFEPGEVSVVLDDGKTLWQSGGPASPHEVAVRVDQARFFDHFFSCFG